MSDVENKDNEIKQLKARIQELETINRALADKVNHYESMNVVKTIIHLSKQYEELDKKIRDTEERLKKAQKFLGNDSNPGLNGEFAQNLEELMKAKAEGKISDTGEISLKGGNSGNVLGSLLSLAGQAMANQQSPVIVDEPKSEDQQEKNTDKEEPKVE